MLKAQGKPRKKSYHFNIKTKGAQNDTDDNKNPNRATREDQRAGKEERFNSKCIDCAGTVEIVGGEKVKITDEGLNAIEQYADKKKKADVLLLVQIMKEIREIKEFLQNGNYTGNGSNNSTNGTNNS